MYTLGTAAKACGVSKTTIHRAIRSGRISARGKDDGQGYEIDPAELHRVFPAIGVEGYGNGSAKGDAGRSATGEGNGGNAPQADPELAVRLARAEASLEALKEIVEMERKIVEMERKRAEELRVERDRWAGIAEASQRQITHLTTKPPEPPAVIPMPAPEAPLPVASETASNQAASAKRAGWWPWRRSA